MDTLFKGRCYLLKGGNESKIYWHLNIPANESIANIYVLPEHSENALILGIWHHPIKMMRVGRLEYQTKVIQKEFHMRKSARGRICTEESEEMYYQVSGIVINKYYDNLKQYWNITKLSEQ